MFEVTWLPFKDSEFGSRQFKHYNCILAKINDLLLNTSKK